MSKKSREKIISEQIKRNLEENQRRQEEILAKEKSPLELIAELEGLVTKVTSRNIPTHRQEWNGVIGPGSSAREVPSGTQRLLEIEIQSESGVKFLDFYGDCMLQKGDEIKAYVVKSKEEELPMPIFPSIYQLYGDRKPKTHVLVEGDFQERMIAIQIDIPEKGITNYGTNYDPDNGIITDF